MSRTHPEYFDPQTVDRLVVANGPVGGDPEEDEPEDEEDDEGQEDGDEEEDEGYSE